MIEKCKQISSIIVDKTREYRVFTPQNLGFYLIAALSVSVMYNGSKVIQQNYELTQKVREIEQENRVIELENRNKELKNQYYATEEYADITARSSFGRALPEEQVYIVPSTVSERVLQTPKNEDEITVAEQEIPQYRKNIEAWLNIYFGKN